VPDGALGEDLAAQVGQEEPQQDVRGDSDASDEGQDDRRRPDEDRVDAQPAGQPRAHAAEPAALGVTNGAQTSQPGEGVVEE
jgi:hypothetical protein